MTSHLKPHGQTWLQLRALARASQKTAEVFFPGTQREIFFLQFPAENNKIGF